MMIFQPGQVIAPLPGLLVGLVYNDAYLGSRDRALVETHGYAPLLWWGIALTAVSTLLMLRVPRRARREYRLLAVVAGFLLVWLLGNWLPGLVPLPPVAPGLAITVRAIGALAFPLAAVRLVPSNWLFLGFALWFAGSLGNAASFIYSPAGAVDMFHVKALSWRLQMFNIADLALLLGDGVLITYPLVRVAGRSFGFAD